RQPLGRYIDVVAVTPCESGGAFALLVIEPGQQRESDVIEGAELLRSEQIENIPPHDLRVTRSGIERHALPLVGDPDHRAAVVLHARFATQEAALFHPPKLVREAALLPIETTA